MNQVPEKDRKTKNVSILLTNRLYLKIEDARRKAQRSRNDYLNLLLEEYFEEEQEEGKEA